MCVNHVTLVQVFCRRLQCPNWYERTLVRHNISRSMLVVGIILVAASDHRVTYSRAQHTAKLDRFVGRFPHSVSLAGSNTPDLMTVLKILHPCSLISVNTYTVSSEQTLSVTAGPYVLREQVATRALSLFYDQSPTCSTSSICPIRQELPHWVGHYPYSCYAKHRNLEIPNQNFCLFSQYR